MLWALGRELEPAERVCLERSVVGRLVRLAESQRRLAKTQTRTCDASVASVVAAVALITVAMWRMWWNGRKRTPAESQSPNLEDATGPKTDFRNQFTAFLITYLAR